MTDEDWIQHDGGPCPGGLEDTYVAIRTRHDGPFNPRQGRFWRWEHRDTAGDIMAYRIADGPVVAAKEEGVV
ncbi:hypothetical protein [Bosea sp. LjRoot237]|uniref:hypothetical protein n=1 Tax=Bosea sp. LjRoot237 TaxID=3342292 RepID=UPI003ECC8D22